jgi:hypothetical protein
MFHGLMSLSEVSNVLHSCLVGPRAEPRYELNIVLI